MLAEGNDVRFSVAILSGDKAAALVMVMCKVFLVETHVLKALVICVTCVSPSSFLCACIVGVPWFAPLTCCGGRRPSFRTIASDFPSFLPLLPPLLPLPIRYTFLFSVSLSLPLQHRCSISFFARLLPLKYGLLEIVVAYMFERGAGSLG